MRDYNALGICRIAAASANLVTVMMDGSGAEINLTIRYLIETAYHEFPNGPLSLRDDVNKMCSDFDLPLIISARQKDSGKIL